MNTCQSLHQTKTHKIRIMNNDSKSFSSKFCNFNAIFKFVCASVVPSPTSAPSSGTPCPASNTIVFPDAGVAVVSIVLLISFVIIPLIIAILMGS